MSDRAAPRFFASFAALAAFLAVCVWPFVGYSWRDSAGLLAVAVVLGMVAHALAAELRRRRREEHNHQVWAVRSWTRPDPNTIRVRRAS